MEKKKDRKPQSRQDKIGDSSQKRERERYFERERERELQWKQTQRIHSQDAILETVEVNVSIALSTSTQRSTIGRDHVRVCIIPIDRRRTIRHGFSWKSFGNEKRNGNDKEREREIGWADDEDDDDVTRCGHYLFQFGFNKKRSRIMAEQDPTDVEEPNRAATAQSVCRTNVSGKRSHKTANS